MTEETHDAARGGPARHRDVDRGLAGRRLGPADRAHVRDPELRRRARQPDRRAARADLHRRGRRRPAASCCCSSSIGAQLFCGMASVTANSRMIYAFSRDGALPGSRFWHRSTPGPGRPPTRSGWPPAARFVLGLPYLWNATAYAAVTSIAVIGLYIAYVLPTFLRLRQGDGFQRGPWHLGRWSRPIGIDRRGLGRLHHDAVHAARRPARSPGRPSTTRRSRCSSCSVSPASGGSSRRRTGSPGPKVQGTPEELAADRARAGEPDA